MSWATVYVSESPPGCLLGGAGAALEAALCDFWPKVAPTCLVFTVLVSIAFGFKVFEKSENNIKMSPLKLKVKPTPGNDPNRKLANMYTNVY